MSVYDEITDRFESQREKRASTLIGRDDAARLRWLAKFAEEADELARLPDTEFKRMQAAIEAFACLGGSVSRNVGEDLTVEKAAELACTVRDGLRGYAKGSTWDLPSLDFAELQQSLVPGEDRPVWIGHWRILFLKAASDIVCAERRRLLTCPEQGCGRLFVKRGRALYCSAACAQREHTRRFQRNRERYRRKRHEYYKRHIEKTKGKSVAGKVRPRKAIR